MRFFKMAVAIDQHHGFKPFSRSQRCKLQSYTQLDSNILELSQTNLARSLKQVFEVASIPRSFSTPCLSLNTSVEEDFSCIPKIEIVGGHVTPMVRALVVEVAIAMASNVDPLPVSSGLGGAYFFRGQNGNKIAVAKPADEEPFAFNNPKGFGGHMLGQPGIKRSVRIGETSIREYAAYLLDHDGFAHVPPTALVKLRHTAFHVTDPAAAPALPCKMASLQRFVDHEFDAGELGPSGFSIASVHQIGIFDLRLLNLDRHAGNMLVKKHEPHSYDIGDAELVPIDHGLCLPEWLDDPYFEWLHWPQASVPFSESEIDYISKLDPFKDAELLRTEIPLLRESSVRVLVVCTIFLKQAVAAGLCLADIGELMTREFCSGEETFSELEIVCSNAKAGIPCISFLNQIIVETEEEVGILQFDIETEGDILEVLDHHQPRKIYDGIPKHPKKTSRFLSIGSMSALQEAAVPPMFEENEYENKNVDAENTKCNNGRSEKCDNYPYPMEGGLVKSMSFPAQTHSHEAGGISFGDMDKDEWESFLDIFVNLLPAVFEEKKCTKSKPRLGTSCEF